MATVIGHFHATFGAATTVMFLSSTLSYVSVDCGLREETGETRKEKGEMVG